MLTGEQVRLQADAAFRQGIFQKVVATEAAAPDDDSMASEIKR